MSGLNKCNSCGKFKPWSELKSDSSDSDDLGVYQTWLECTECQPIDESPKDE